LQPYKLYIVSFSFGFLALCFLGEIAVNLSQPFFFLIFRPASLMQVRNWVFLVGEDFGSLWPLQQTQGILTPLGGCGVIMRV
jgi:hypothetical protein